MQSRYRPYGDADTKKSELQRRMESMVTSCNGIAQKSKNKTLKIQNDQHMLGEKSTRAETMQSPSASVSLQVVAPSSIKDSSTIATRKASIDSLQNCYGRSSTGKVSKLISTNPDDALRGILSKPSTPKPSTPKRVTFNLDANNSEPPTQNSVQSISDFLAPSEQSYQSDSVAFPDVSAKRPGKASAKQSLFQAQSAKPTRPSLSEQLSAIANKAGDLTAEIKAKAGIAPAAIVTGETPIYSSPVKNFTVGTLQCRW